MKRILIICLTILSIGFSQSLNGQACQDIPAINSFEPNTGFIGSIVTIYGANFDATNLENNVVYFGATKADVISATFGQLEVVVPIGASTAPISVTNQCELTAYSKVAFNGLFCPTPLDNQSYDNVSQELGGVYGAYNMLSQDMDLDGKPEVLSSSNGGGITVAINNSTPGNLSFRAYNQANGGGQSIVTADFDGDGLKDVLYTYGVNRNTSTGPGNVQLANAVGIPAISNYQVAAGDFNNDGKIDIIGQNGNWVRVAFNVSTGVGNIAFTGYQDLYDVGPTCTGIQATDIDGDGKIDFISSQRFGNRAVSLRNTTTNGSFTASFEAPEYWASDSDPNDGFGTEPYRSQLADFDKDGKIDFTSCNFAGNTNTAIWRNISTVGDINFAPTVNLPAPIENYRIQVGDVDGDGYPDIVTKSLGDRVFAVYRNSTTTEGVITFEPRIEYRNSPAAAEVSGIVIGDLDGDFVPDIATSGINSNTIRFHRNTSAQVDSDPPTALAKDIIVGLSPAGTVTITPQDVDNGSSDACGLDRLELDKMQFTCADIGENEVELTVYDNAGNATSVKAIVNVQPAAIIVSGQSTVCAGETIPMTANAGDSYQWFKDEVAILGGTNQTYNAGETGAYTVAVTNAGGCSGTSVPTDITISGSASVVVTATSDTYCTGVALTSAQGALYQWSKDGVEIQDATLQTYLADGPGDYSVEVVDLFGCTASGSYTILPDTQAPTISLNGPATMVINQGDLYNEQGVTVADNCGYQVVTTGTVNPNNIEVYTLTYQAIDDSGNVSNLVSREVTVVPASISIEANGETEFCPGGSVELAFLPLAATKLVDEASVQPVAAIGMRKLIGTYNGPAIRIRRASDNAAQDFGFSGTDLDIDDIDAFLAGSQGYVFALYDQSGNGNDFIQTNEAAQPFYIKAGFNGKPTFSTASGARRITNNISLVPEFTVIYGARQIGPSRGRMLSGINNNWLLGWWGGYKNQYYSQGWVGGPYGAAGDNTSYVYTGTGAQSTDNYQFFINSQLSASNTGGSQGPAGLALGAGGTNSYEQSDGLFTDLVAYNTVLSTEDRTLVEEIIGSYYGIFGTAPTTASTYTPALQWMRDGGTIDGATNEVYAATESGSYSVDLNVNGTIVSSNTIQVIAEDDEAPVLTMTGTDLIVELGDTYTEQGATVTDNCDSPTVEVGGDAVNTAVAGFYTVTYDATDVSENVATQLIRVVEVQDNTNPVAIAQDVTVYLDANGNASVTPEQVNDGSSDASNDITLSLDQTAFECSQFGVSCSGSSIAFNGTGIASGANGDNIQNLGLDQLTMEAWVKPNGGTVNSIIRKAGDYDLYIANNTLYAEVWYEGRASSAQYWYTGPTVSDNVWSHLAFTFDKANNGSGKFYVNGVETVASGASRSITPDITLGIGGSTEYGQSFTGLIDDVRIWSVERTNTEINEFKDFCIDANSVGLEAYFKIEANEGTTLTDYSGNGNHLTITGTSWSFEGAPIGSQGVEVTLTVTDASNNSATATASITVLDNIAPTLVGVPADVTVECSAVPMAADVSTTDNCANPSVTFIEERIDGISNNDYTLTRTWTATDASGNTASATQMIMVEDNIAPTLVGVPADVTVEFDAVPTVANVAATDNCDPNPLVTFIEERIDGISNNDYTLTRTWTATDDSGNTASGTQVITVVDATAPTVITRDITVQLDENGNMSITPEQINDGSSDDSGSITLSLNQTDFDCNDIGTEQTAEYALQLDGVNDFVNMGDFGGALNNASQATYQVWVNVLDLGTSYASVIEANNGSNRYLSMEIISGTGQLGVWVSGGAVHTTNSVINLNGWVSLTAVYDGTQVSATDRVKIYVNGVDQALNDPGNIPSSTLGDIEDIIIGSQRGEIQFSNIIYDEARVWNYALSPSEVANNWNQTIVGNETGLLGYYSFEDGPGSPTVTELTGNQGLAVLNNMDPNTAWVAGADGLSQGGTGVQVTLTVTDASNNSSTATALVTVEDNIAPEITAPADISVFATGATGAVVNYTAPIGTDNCSVTTALTAGFADGATFPIGTTLVTYTATDGSGNATSASFNVNVTGLPPEVVVPANITVSNDAGVCEAIVNYAATETVGIPASVITYSIAPGSSFAVGTTTVTATATNPVGTSTQTFTVTVTDNEAPNAITQNRTVQLDASGHASITAAEIDNGSNDNCAIESVEFLTGTTGGELISNGSFDSSLSDWTQVGPYIEYRAGAGNPGGYAVLNDVGQASDPGLTQVVNGFVIGETYTITGDNKNQYNCCGAFAGQIAFAVDLDGNEIAALPNPGTAWSPFSVTFTATSTTHTIGFRGEINGTDTDMAIDNISILSPAENVTASTIDFDCTNALQANVVTLLVTDVAGNQSTETAIVTVEDNIAPVITAPADINVFATSAAGAVVNYITPVGTDNCTVTTALTTGLADGATFPIGTTVVTYEATDASDNTASDSFVVTVTGIAPEIVVPANITVSNDAGVCEAIVNYAATETTGIPESIITYDIIPGSSFAVGTTIVTATATNAVGTSTQTFTVTVEDNEMPVVTTQNLVIDLDANGNASITAAQIDAGSTDNCGVAGTVLSQTFFDCSNVGENTVTLTVTDIHNNVQTGTATVTVNDVTAAAIDAHDITVQLDVNGNFSLDGDNLLSTGEVDPRELLIARRALARASAVNRRNQAREAAYENLLQQQITEVEDAEAVVAEAQLGVEEGNVTLLAAQEELANATTEAEILTATQNVARAEAILERLQARLNALERRVVSLQGLTEETRQRIDGAQTATQESTLALADAQAALDALENPEEGIFGTTSDACGVETIIASQLDFDCSHVGPNTVTLTVTDVNDNVSTMDVIVNVEDNVKPTVVTNDITIQLDENGNASITASDINNGSNDACGILSTTIDISSFDCSDINEVNTVTLTVTDNNGNVETGTAIVTVEDNVKPTVITKDITIVLDDSGNASITAADINDGSSDACGILSTTIDVSTFACADVFETNVVTLTVTDNNGNVETGTAIVTVEDNTAPVVITQPITVALDANGEYTIQPSDVDGGTTDACTFTLSLDNNVFNCSTLGENTVLLTATDPSGNSTTEPAIVTVIDNAAPTIVANNIEVQLDENGKTSITVSDVDGGTYDNCAVATVTIDINSFNCDNLGENTVTITATDVNGNTSTGPAIVTVVDVIAPTVGTRNISVELDENGGVSITPEEVLILSEDDLATGEDCTVSAAEYHAMWLSKYIKANSGYGKNKGSYRGKGKKKGHYYKKYKDTRFVFDATGGSISRNLDGTATVTGTLVSTNDDDDRWVVTLNLENARNWAEWSALGRSYKDEKRLAGKRYLDWTYYEMAEGSVLTGAGDNEGEEVALSHAPHDYRYGFQLGDAANSKNGNFGMSGWFFYTNRDGKQVQGDFNLDIADCADQPLPPGSVITSDNCSIVSYELDHTSFDCTNLGENTVQVTVTDQSGNATTETAIVTVSDNIAPVAVATNITVSLGADGTVEVDGSELDGGSTDNTDCELTYILSKNFFDCDDIGKGSYYQDDHSCDDDRHRNKKGKGHYSHKGNGYGHKKGSKKKGHRVVLTVTDGAGNSSTAYAYITVVDDLAPVISSDPVTIVVYDRRKEYLKKYDVEPRVTDNCEVYKVYFPRTRFDRTDVGMNTVMVTATDKSGNTATGPLNVNVIDISSYGKRVTICYRGRSYRVSKSKVQYYMRKGASLGTCSTDITMAVGGSDLNNTIQEPEPAWEPLIELGAFPNPSQGETTIKFSSDVAGPAMAVVMSPNGVRMNTLFDGEIAANENVEVRYITSELPSGVYIIRLVTAGEVRNLKLMVKK